MKVNFEPIGKLTVKKQYHYACITLAVILPIALIIVTILKGTFSPMTLLVCAGIIIILLGIDYSNRSNMVIYNHEQIVLTKMFGKPTLYRWDMLKDVYNSTDTMRMEFSDGKKLYINMEYDGISEFITFLNSITENK